MSNTINICTERIKMQILIKNAAKILNAELVVDGITTIAGHNNMGKSTILKSIYVALNTFRNSTDKIIASRKQSIRSYLTQKIILIVMVAKVCPVIYFLLFTGK